MLAFSAATASAAPTPGAYKQNDFGGFRNILPPAQGANANSNQIAAFEANGNYPPHTSDQQLSMYSNLLYATPGLQASQIHNFYKDASFGVMPTHVARTYSPRSDVTIERDQFGVPHIYGATREGTMFGAGYAVAEDRLFMIDALRHAARAQLSSFAGGANAAMDESIWADTPYNESDLQRQYDRADELYGQDGVQIQTDVNNYVAGVNKFISEACTDPTQAARRVQPDRPVPEHLSAGPPMEGRRRDRHRLAGRRDLRQGRRRRARRRTGSRRRPSSGSAPSTGRKVWADFQSFNDPEAPTTVHGKSFPYGQPPAQAAGVALPDPGTVQPANVVQSASASAQSLGRPRAWRQAPGRDPEALPAAPRRFQRAARLGARVGRAATPSAVIGSAGRLLVACRS